MTDRFAVLTTLNGKIVEWKLFDNRMRGMEYYSAGVNKLSEIITHTGDANQFARSFPENEAQGGGSISENMLLERDEGGVWEQEISNILSTE